MAEEPEQRTPTTLESTCPFFRNLFGIPYDWPEWMERIVRTQALDHVADLFERHAVPIEEYIDDANLAIRAELAGIDPGRDVEITVSDGALRILAERRGSNGGKGVVPPPRDSLRRVVAPCRLARRCQARRGGGLVPQRDPHHPRASGP